MPSTAHEFLGTFKHRADTADVEKTTALWFDGHRRMWRRLWPIAA